ncbi:high affinity copper uptake protein 1-like isoform X3 [Coccinella septempunctata]|uniref:high affinity copper uptake protein 1-like isoform X3 n=1 Tax=Coccinella septempunctata TaxID=41139 RepID=UPI001D0946BD|nr:high affinity copper uptake protein 1-like isoform X3 [Coccinella septempunctata]
MEHHGHDMHHTMHSHNHSAMPKIGTDAKGMDMGGMDHMDMGMKMFFHFGTVETVLFEQWKFSTVGGLVGSMIGILIMAALYEGLKYYREYLFWKTYNALQYRAVSIPEKGVVNEENQIVQPTMWSKMHSFQTFLHMIQMVLSYFLMLIFMTYNIWLCIAVVIGAGIGYFLFGWKKSVIVDVTEHCH